MSRISNLYLLVFPKHRVIKIGKADDIHNRIQALKKWWGDVDYEGSYFLSAPHSLIFKLEKTLHFLLSAHSVDFDDGDGKTELFAADALETAIRHIEIYCNSNHGIGKIKKGIAPLMDAKIAYKNKYEKLRKKSETMAQHMSVLADQFNNIFRIIILLIRRQNKIQYQYDIENNTVLFRIRLPENKSHIGLDKLARYFSFDVEDFFGLFSANCCSILRKKDIIQYRIQFVAVPDGFPCGAIFTYFTTQLKWLLAKLPPRSIAATVPLPVLDEDDFFECFKSNYAD